MSNQLRYDVTLLCEIVRILTEKEITQELYEKTWADPGELLKIYEFILKKLEREPSSRLSLPFRIIMTTELEYRGLISEYYLFLLNK